MGRPNVTLVPAKRSTEGAFLALQRQRKDISRKSLQQQDEGSRMKLTTLLLALLIIFVFLFFIFPRLVTTTAQSEESTKDSSCLDLGFTESLMCSKCEELKKFVSDEGMPPKQEYRFTNINKSLRRTVFGMYQMLRKGRC